MDLDRRIADNDQKQPADLNGAPRSKPPVRFRFSLRALLLLVVPIAILSLMYRWLHDNGYALKVWRAGQLGAFWGIVVLAIGRGLSNLVRDSNEPNEPLLQDLQTVFLAALLGAFGAASFLALVLWLAKTFA